MRYKGCPLVPSIYVFYLLCISCANGVNRGSDDYSESVYSGDEDPFYLETRVARPDYFNFNPGPSFVPKGTEVEEHLSDRIYSPPPIRNPPNTPKFTERSPQRSNPYHPYPNTDEERSYNEKITRQDYQQHQARPTTPRQIPNIRNDVQQNKPENNAPSSVQTRNWHERGGSKDSNRADASPITTPPTNTGSLFRSNSCTKTLLNRRKVTTPNIRSPPAHYFPIPSGIFCPICKVTFGRIEILKDHLDVHMT